MPFWRHFVHLVWTTKNRQPFIGAGLESRLYAQIADKAGKLGCYVHAVNGMADHVHVVASIPPKLSVADVVKSLKGSSAHFVNHVVQPLEFHFQWQRGYGCLSLGETQLPRAVAYVERQKEHHAQQSTNPWLEQSSDQSEGPTSSDGDPDRVGVIREEASGYDVFGDAPF